MAVRSHGRRAGRPNGTARPPRPRSQSPTPDPSPPQPGGCGPRQSGSVSPRHAAGGASSNRRRSSGSRPQSPAAGTVATLPELMELVFEKMPRLHPPDKQQEIMLDLELPPIGASLRVVLQEEELLLADERQERQLLFARFLARKVNQRSAAEGKPKDPSIKKWLQRVAEGAGLGPGVCNLNEARAFAILTTARDETLRELGLSVLRKAWERKMPQSVLLDSGFAKVAVADAPRVDRGGNWRGARRSVADVARERMLAAARGADGFAARQQLGAIDPSPATAAEPGAVRKRREGLLPAYSDKVKEEWKVSPAPEGQQLREGAKLLYEELRRVICCLEEDRPSEAGSKSIDFILALPSGLHAASPSTADWFFEEHVTTKEVWDTRKIRIPHRAGVWERRDTGMLGQLADLLRRAAEQVQWTNTHNIWDDLAQISKLVPKMKTDDGLTVKVLAQLTKWAETDIASFRTLISKWDTASCRELLIAGWLYCSNLSPLRFGPSVFDKMGNPVDGYEGRLVKNCCCQLYFVWNKALREHTDPEWPLPVTDEEAECNRRVVELFAPMSYLLTQLIRGLATAGEAPIVSRGISIRISDMYDTGTAVPLAQFTSTSTADQASLKFAGRAGSWFKMQVINAAPVSFLSPYPAERELLLPPGTMTEVGFKFGGTLLMLLESRRDLVFLSEWSDNPREMAETVEQRCRTLKDSSMLYEDFTKKFVEPLCDVYVGDGPDFCVGEGRKLYEVFSEFLYSKDVHFLVLIGGGGIGKSSSLVALAHEASRAADWVPFFDGLHQIEGLLDRPGRRAVKGCYQEHLKRRVLQCRDADAALELFLKRKIFHALDSLDEAPGSINKTCPLLPTMGLEPGPHGKVSLSVRPEYLEMESITMQDLHHGKTWRVELRGFGKDQVNRFAQLSAESWARGRDATAGEKEAAKQRVKQGLTDLQKSCEKLRPGADDTLMRTPFAAKMTADLALAERMECVTSGPGFEWRIVSEWVALEVESGTCRYPGLAKVDRALLLHQSARVALALGILLILTAEWQGVLSRFAAVLRRPFLLKEHTDPGEGDEPGSDSDDSYERGWSDGLRFSPRLGADEREELADYLDELLQGVQPELVRDILGVLPLRCEHLDSDSGLFSFRHKLVAEWIVALWIVHACQQEHKGKGFRPPALLAKRFISPHCLPSFTLLLEMLEFDAGLLTLFASCSSHQQRGQLTRRRTLDEQMGMRLHRMTQQQNQFDPMPAVVPEEWVREIFAEMVMNDYDAAGRKALTRRQMGTMWSVEMLGEEDRVLTDEEWSGTKQVFERGRHPGHAPSVVQAVGMAGGTVSAGAVELSTVQLGQWLWGLIEWLTGPSTRDPTSYKENPCLRLYRYSSNKMSPTHCLAQGLYQLWGAAVEASQPWSVPRVAAQLVGPQLMRRCAEQRVPAGGLCIVRRLQVVRLIAANDSARTVPLPPDCSLPIKLLFDSVAAPDTLREFEHNPLRRAAAAEPAVALRAAAAAAVIIAPGQGADSCPPDLMRECWHGREGDWGAPSRLMCGAAEIVRKDRVDGVMGYIPRNLPLHKYNPSAEQITKIGRKAKYDKDICRVTASDCQRLSETPVAAALVELVSGCETVVTVDIKRSPMPVDLQQQLHDILARRPSGQLDGSSIEAEAHVRFMCEELSAGGDELKLPYQQLSAQQLEQVCKAADGARLRAVDVRSVRSVPEAGWEPFAELMRRSMNVRELLMQGGCSAPQQLHDELCDRITAPGFFGVHGYFRDDWGREGVREVAEREQYNERSESKYAKLW
eukprot:TRINITY_DN9525_c0_g1_i1.p1 TRINITY_DN9525_c0_g1~~TRINITY_DN9525_c0_g1_i1.p1  ORF type:complete len:1776 (+),score=501.42 TRINITY_DN9525_c0_g1_i1:109-5436(+)